MAKPEITTSYRWDEQQLIRRIDVRQQSNGQAVAYLYADPNPALQQNRNDLRAALRLKGWGTLSDHRGGEFALRVTGLRSGDELIQMLQHEGIAGAPQTQASATNQNTEAPQGLWQSIRGNSLKWSGIIASVGNVIGIARGAHNRQVAARLDGTQAKQWGEIGKGLAFMFSDLPMAIAGEHNDARQLSDFLYRLKSHYEKEGIEIPGTASINVETSNKGKSFGERSMDVMHRYANQFKCSFEVLAAFLSIKGGAEQKLWPKKYAPFFWGTGFALSGLISEKKIDEEKYAQAGPLSRLWMKIQANPLVIGGTLGWTNNAADLYSAKIGHKRWSEAGRTGTPLWAWDIATPATMVSANGLYAMSKKTVGGDIKNSSMVSDAYTIAAQIINKQPEALREKAIESTAKFFGERVEIPEQRAEVIARLREEIDIQRKNPWFEQKGLPPYEPQPNKPRVHLAEATQHVAAPSTQFAVNASDKAVRRNAPATTLAAANDREHVAPAAALEAQLN